MKVLTILCVVLLSSTAPTYAQNKNESRKVIDVHFHALKWNSFGTPPPPNDVTGVVPKAKSDSAEQAAMLSALKQNNVVKVVLSGVPDLVKKYENVYSDNIIMGLLVENLKELPDTVTFVQSIKEGRLKVFGELDLQYFGKTLGDPIFEPYISICERFNIPIALHTGTSFPNTPYICCPEFRTRFGNPQLIEDVLVKHPKLRVQMMHMGYPFLEETKAILGVYPQVYVDVAAVDWLLPKTEFYMYLKALVDAGFEDRIMYGSDEMIWDDSIQLSLKNIEDAPFLSEHQKQDIFYNNAAKFFNIRE